MEFADYLALLRRRWWLVALAVVVCLLGAGAATFLQTPKYRTGTRLLVSASSSETAIDEITKRQLSSQRAVAYAQYASTRPAITAAVEASGAQGLPEVTAVADSSSPFLTITVTSPDAQAAAAVANAYVDVLPRVVTQLDQAPSGTQLPQLSVLEGAAVPAQPFSPRPARNLLVALVLGLVLGFAAALLRETLDKTIRRSSDVEGLTGVTLLGVVPREYGDERLIAMTRPRSRRTEAYRQVRTNLEFSGPGGMPSSLVVTSAAPGEGKSTLAANLAVIASHAGKRVLLVDADLRRPTIATVMGVQPEPGLSDVLTGRATLEQVLQPVDESERLFVMASGPLPQSPSELLGSSAMVELIGALESRFDVVLFDSPPVLPVTDALLIGVNVGGVVVVARLAQTTTTALRRSLELVGNVKATVLGVVANGAVEEDDKRYGYGYGYLDKNKSATKDLLPVDHIEAGGRRELQPAAAAPVAAAPAVAAPAAAPAVRARTTTRSPRPRKDVAVSNGAAPTEPAQVPAAVRRPRTRAKAPVTGPTKD